MGDEGAAHGFGAQKGADRAARELLETGLRTWATQTDGGVAVKGGRRRRGRPRLRPAAARRRPGERHAAGPRRRAPGRAGGRPRPADQRRRRVRLAVAARQGGGRRRPAGQRAGRPTVVLAGRVEVGRRELAAAGVDAAYAPTTCPSVTRSHRGGGLRRWPPGSRAPGRDRAMHRTGHGRAVSPWIGNDRGWPVRLERGRPLLTQEQQMTVQDQTTASRGQGGGHRAHRRRGGEGQEPARAGGPRRPPAARRRAARRLLAACATSCSSTSAPSTATWSPTSVASASWSTG